MPKEDTQFKKGNPGRPKGARNKFGEDFISALKEDFNEHGKTGRILHILNILYT